MLEQAGNGTKIAKRLRTEEGYVDLTAGTGTTARRYFVRDHLGSVRAVVDGSGTSLETDDYYPLGGPLPTGSNTTLQPEKDQGKDWNPTASFNVYDFGARLYDPALGRWLSQDPLAEKCYAHSPYLFCAGNPMKFVDPTGEKTNPIFDLCGDRVLTSWLRGTYHEATVTWKIARLQILDRFQHTDSLLFQGPRRTGIRRRGGRR